MINDAIFSVTNVSISFMIALRSVLSSAVYEILGILVEELSNDFHVVIPSTCSLVKVLLFLLAILTLMKSRGM
jgi:hypothetical protein